MAAHNRLGKEGEDAVAAYLERKGYTILHRNWRKNRLELDIVATHDGELVVVEVKTRTNTDYKEPQEAVDWRKVRHIVVAADAYIKHFGIDLPVRFDIVTAVATGRRSRSSIWRMLSIRHNFKHNEFYVQNQDDNNS